jgi:serine protease Do
LSIVEGGATKANSLVHTLLVAGLSAGLAAGCSGANGNLVAKNSVVATNASPAETSLGSSMPSAASALPDFSSLVEKYGPAVVNISVTESMRTSGGTQELPNIDPNDPFWQFFRSLPMPKAPPHALMRGVGSGFIVSADGVILTNAHVVDNAKEVTVRLTDRREFKAKVVGKDDQSDIAVLRIRASHLPTVELGDSSQLKVGQWVVAIGSPYGFDNSVTAGIVSAKARSLGESYVPFVQTDVPVNPGNSGGPLFDLKGEVVGINSQIYSRSGGFQGLSFAIPINVAARVEHQLLESGHVTRGRIGVTIQDVTQGLANSFGLKSPTGALVSSVDPDGAAAKAGLQAGDVILKVNGQELAQSTDLPVRVAAAKPGTKITLQVWRAGVTKNVTVTVGEFGNQSAASTAEPSGEHERLGMVVRPLTPDERQQARIEGGVLVNEASGVAAEAGIEAGDIILAVNNTPVKSVQQLRSLVDKAGKHVALLIRHGDASEFVALDLG